MFTQVLEQIKKYNTIIIHRHTNPDGDALGSQIGLKNIILNNFPEKTVYIVGDSSKRYGFMDGSTMDEIPDDVYNGALAIILDLSAKHLISDDRYTLADMRVRIDHHIFVENIAEVEVVNTTYESCCGLIAEFAYTCGLALNPAAAKALYTGMVTDSGRFRYDSTTSQTFRLASFIMEQDFSTNDIFKNLYCDELKNVQLRAKFTLKINKCENNVAYIYTTFDEFKTYDADVFAISRGMVNTMSDIKGIDTWVNFTETEDSVLCEIRSSKHNINKIAVKYGGGGHMKASGATLKNREEAMALLSDLINITEN